MRALDLFSAAAGGWSLGMHRAGFTTIAACEIIEWRRILYAENNPGVRLYDDIRTLTADRLLADLGTLPDIIVGSPPCQDISSANSKGKGVDGERSGLFFEAVRIIGEVRPRWFALENSPNLRTKGADRVLSALAALGYACEPLVVGADDAGANHERKRAWIIGFDPEQLADADGHGWADGRSGWRIGGDLSVSHDHLHAAGLGREGWWARRHGTDGDGPAYPGDAESDGRRPGRARGRAVSSSGVSVAPCGDGSDADEARREVGYVVSGLGAPESAQPGRFNEQADPCPHADDQGQPDGTEHDEVGGRAGAGGYAGEPWADWNGGLASHLRLDDGLSAWVAGTRIAVGGPLGTAAASLLVEAFGDSVVPAITEAIGRAILRTEAALAAIYHREAA